MHLLNPRQFSSLTLLLLSLDSSLVKNHVYGSPVGSFDTALDGQQVPLVAPSYPPPVAPSARGLHGRFLHITDIHPDPFYVYKGRLSASCHRKKPKKETAKASFWGTAYSEDCDSPYSLVNLTLEWLESEWADKIDFVIWTGDSSRHDNDRAIPRTNQEIFDLNRRTAETMARIFTSRGVPVVPNMGNNDLYPHNIMFPGPNSITNEYLSIWKAFIPFPAYSVFQRGAYFAVEVIPNQLAVISLNTLYFYDSNKAVDGCEPKTEDPGTLQMNWLEVQLNQFRSRKMQVYIMGHVPPTMGNYYLDCYLSYTMLALRFQDTIVGHLFGHMNVDHFFWVDAHELHHRPEGSMPNVADEFAKKPRYSLAKTLREDYRSLPPAKDNQTDPRDPDKEPHERIHLDDYAIVNVGPSVVPAFVPSLRLFTYNITGWNSRKGKYTGPKSGRFIQSSISEADDGDESDDEDALSHDFIEDSAPDTYSDEQLDEEDDGKKKKKGSKRKHGHDHKRPPGKIDCTKRANRDKDECIFKKPRHASKKSPSRSNKLWTPLGYTQYYLPDIELKGPNRKPAFEIEYMTYKFDALLVPNDTSSGAEWLDGDPKAPDWPVPQHLLPCSLRNLTEVPADKATRVRLNPYGMKDLTIPTWIKLARRLGGNKKQWRKFESFMYLGGEEP